MENQNKMNLAQGVMEYFPSRKAIDLVESVKTVLLVGISGAGKDTVKRLLIQTGEYDDIVSHTTRQPRVNNGQLEVDGIDYHFIDEQKAEEMIEEQGFVEVKFVHGTIYGTSVQEFEWAKRDNLIAITDIDVQGVEEYKKISNKVVAIFILPPNFEEWKRRLAHRYASKAEFLAEWPKRFKSAVSELEFALTVPYYHFVINNNIDETVRIVDEIAKKPDVFTRKDDEARLVARDLLASIIDKNQEVK